MVIYTRPEARSTSRERADRLSARVASNDHARPACPCRAEPRQKVFAGGNPVVHDVIPGPGPGCLACVPDRVRGWRHSETWGNDADWWLVGKVGTLWLKVVCLVDLVLKYSTLHSIE